MIHKAKLIKNLKAMIENPGTEQEGETAKRLLKKIEDKNEQWDPPVVKRMDHLRRCDRCVSPFNVNNRVKCSFFKGELRDVTGCYFDGKSPPWCPFKIIGVLSQNAEN